MELYEADSVVIGAGAVGLAVARALALAGAEVLVLEATGSIGTGISSRNSEVIHAGIYYPAGSLKALCCVEGRHQLYRYVDSHKVPHRRCGKLIVATSAHEAPRLEEIAAHARANGVDDLEALDGAAAAALEPALRSVAALLSPSTGIFDSHAYMLALQGDLEDLGGAVAFHAPVERIEPEAQGRLGVLVGGDAPVTVLARQVVNSAGLQATRIAERSPALADAPPPALRYARGNYFALQGRAPFSHLIYPVPEPGGLGVHLTLDMAGQARFGPDVEWIEAEDYEVAAERGDVFYAAVRRYWPALPDKALVADYAGIRPKLFRGGEAITDFVIETVHEHGVQGLVNLYGIESPGLTSSLAIGERVRDILDTTGA